MALTGLRGAAPAFAHPSRVRLQARKSRCRLSRCSQQERPVKGEALTSANGLLYTFALRQTYCSRTRVIQFAEGVRSPCFRSVFLSTGLCFQKSVTSVPSRSERDCRWLANGSQLTSSLVSTPHARFIQLPSSSQNGHSFARSTWKDGQDHQLCLCSRQLYRTRSRETGCEGMRTLW